MTFDEALAFVTARLLPEVDPVLDPNTVADLVSLAGCEDADGRLPAEDGWVPTFSTVGCYRAIAEGYTIKHGHAVGRFDFTTDGQTFRRAQQLDHIEAQRAMWARKVQVSPSTLER